MIIMMMMMRRVHRHWFSAQIVKVDIRGELVAKLFTAEHLIMFSVYLGILIMLSGYLVILIMLFGYLVILIMLSSYLLILIMLSG